jgi:hypothetical protein
MFCCLLAFLIIGPLGLAATAGRGAAANCCAPPGRVRTRVWEASAVLALAGGAGLLFLAITRPAESQSFFHHLCTYLPLTRTD